MSWTWLLVALMGAAALALILQAIARSGRGAESHEDPPPGRPLQARDGTWVASKGERRIANWLDAHGVGYRYEPEMAGGLTPDFHIEGTDVVVEYWGLAGQDSYEERMLEKIEQYEDHGIDVVSLFPAHLHEMEDVLETELDRRGVLDREGGADPLDGVGPRRADEGPGRERETP